MSLAVQLLGRPCLMRAAGEEYKFRSRKSWALLAYLILSERPPTRSRLASLLYAEAQDPIRALRWSLSEIRRGLGDDGALDGDPVVLQLGADTVVDVEVLSRGSWTDALDLPGLGAELLEGFAIRDAPGFESWLLSEQRHLGAACEAILHEAALASKSKGAIGAAIGYAVRAAAMSPLDENHQALLIRLYRLAGDDAAANKQLVACRELFQKELGIPPGAAVEMAMNETRREKESFTDEASVEAIIEAGSAAVSAGATDAGVQSLRTAVRLADSSGVSRLRVESRLVLAEALIHSLRGFDEEGLAWLHEADEIALADGNTDAAAQARSEIGYVDFLRARYDRAEVWLNDSAALSAEEPSMLAKASAYLGSVESDRANYEGALVLLDEAVSLARAAADPRRESYARSMSGRIHLLRGDLDSAAHALDESIDLADRHHWLAFLPWPQAILGEVQLARSEVAEASELLEQAFARACQLGDPCWESLAARGLALVAEASGETDHAFAVLADSRARGNRLADPYVWLDAYVLDAQCELGRRHDHPDLRVWVDTMRELTSRTGMRELTVRSLLHGAALGNVGDADAAALLASDIDNPRLDLLLALVPARPLGQD